MKTFREKETDQQFKKSIDIANLEVKRKLPVQLSRCIERKRLYIDVVNEGDYAISEFFKQIGNESFDIPIRIKKRPLMKIAKINGLKMLKNKINGRYRLFPIESKPHKKITFNPDMLMKIENEVE